MVKLSKLSIIDLYIKKHKKHCVIFITGLNIVDTKFYAEKIADLFTKSSACNNIFEAISTDAINEQLFTKKQKCLYICYGEKIAENLLQYKNYYVHIDPKQSYLDKIYSINRDINNPRIVINFTDEIKLLIQSLITYKKYIMAHKPFINRYFNIDYSNVSKEDICEDIFWNIITDIKMDLRKYFPDLKTSDEIVDLPKDKDNTSFDQAMDESLGIAKERPKINDDDIKLFY